VSAGGKPTCFSPEESEDKLNGRKCQEAKKTPGPFFMILKTTFSR
jgi:hypothetical protein